MSPLGESEVKQTVSSDVISFEACQFSMSEINVTRFIHSFFFFFCFVFKQLASHRDMIIKDFQAYFESFSDYFPDSN